MREMARAGTHDAAFRLIQDIKLSKSALILDCGCGEGALLKRMMRKGFSNLYGCDLDIKHCANYHWAKFQNQDLNKPFRYSRNKFDLVLSVENLEHLENHRHFFRECHRVLKKHGKLLISTPNVETWYHKIYFLFFSKFLDFKPEDNINVGHITPFFEYTLRSYIGDNFKIIKHTYSDSLVPLLHLKLGIKNKLTSQTHFIVLEKI